MIRFALTLSIALSVVCFSRPAAAQDGTLQVRVTDSAGRPTDGTVTLDGPGGRRSCRTVAGRCTFPLPAGTWRATLVPVRDQAPPPSTVTVSANRSAVLTMRTRPTTVVGSTQVTGTQAAVVTRRHTPNTPAVTTQTQTGTVTTRRTGTTNGTTTTNRTTATTTTAQQRPTTTVTQRANTTQVRPQVIQTNPAIQQQTPTSTQQATQTRPQANTTVATRNLGQGNRVCVNGSVVDSAGRPTDATMTVSQNGRVVGTVRSVASRFSVFDLPPGRYEVRATPARGGSAVQMILSVGSAVARWTIRTP